MELSEFKVGDLVVFKFDALDPNNPVHAKVPAFGNIFILIGDKK